MKKNSSKNSSTAPQYQNVRPGLPPGQQSVPTAPPPQYQNMGIASPSGGPMPPPPPYQPRATVLMPGGFDAGARFDHITRPTIPPPPPGCQANAAQVAMYGGYVPVANQQTFIPGYGPGMAMQYQYQAPMQMGTEYVITQQPQNFWDGNGNGGWTFF